MQGKFSLEITFIWDKRNGNRARFVIETLRNGVVAWLGFLQARTNATHSLLRFWRQFATPPPRTLCAPYSYSKQDEKTWELS